MYVIKINDKVTVENRRGKYVYIYVCGKKKFISGCEKKLKKKRWKKKNWAERKILQCKERKKILGRKKCGLINRNKTGNI